MPILAAYQIVDLYLDNDNNAGKNVRASLTALSNAYRDQSCLYASYKDLNDFWASTKGDIAGFEMTKIKPPRNRSRAEGNS